MVARFAPQYPLTMLNCRHVVDKPENTMLKQLAFKILLTITGFASCFSALAVEVGNPIPSCLVSPLGETLTEDLQSYKGQVVYVDFWASWCGPCAKSFPFLNEMNGQLKEKGLRIVGVNLDENLEDAKAFLAKYPANFEVKADISKQCAKDFAVKAMPSSYIIDRKGVVHHIHLGFRPGEAKDIQVIIEKLLSESREG